MSIAADPAMVRRVAAAQATLDRFKDVPFELGVADCARLVTFHLKAMGVTTKLAKAGSYRTALGAMRALRRLGFADLPAALDGHGLLRVPPAGAWVGDIVALPAEDSFGALCIALGNGRVGGFHQDTLGACVMQPNAFVAAWRVL
ncbi:MAG: DUF6950 family protein [Janthinobacterium lividum]